MPSLLDTQTNSLSSTEVSVGSIDNYTEGSTTTSTQLDDLSTPESADLQLSASDIWLATSDELDLAPDENLLSTSISNNDILYEPSAELAAKGVTYDSSPTLSTLVAANTQTDLGSTSWNQTSTLPRGDYSLKTDGSLESSSPTLSTSTTSTSFSSGSSGSLYLASTDTPTISTPFTLTSSSSGSSSSSPEPTSDSGSTPTTDTNTSTPNTNISTPNTSTSTPNTSTSTPDTTTSTTISTDTPETSSTSGSPSDSTSITTSSQTTSSTSLIRTEPSPDTPVAVPFEMHSTIGLLVISFVIGRKMLHRQKVEKLVRIH